MLGGGRIFNLAKTKMKGVGLKKDEISCIARMC